MDPLTHIGTGFVLARAGLGSRHGRAATVALVAASIAPDVDYVMKAGGSAVYLEFHRGLTHSFAGIAALSLLLALIIRGIFLRSERPPPFGSLFGLAFAGMGAHLFLDFINAYGIRPFLPFSGTWYSGDWVFIIDPLVWLLLLGAGVSSWFRPDTARRAARAALAGIAVYIALRAGGHGLAERVVRGQFPQAVKVGIIPLPGNPLPVSWGVLLTTPQGTARGWISLVPRAIAVTETFGQPDGGPVVSRAMNTYTARVFHDFAQFPVQEVETRPDGWRVAWRDLRFSFLTDEPRFMAEVLLTPDLRVRREGFSF